ncbi:uncharacterized protein LOC123948021 isoform X3 [Meles meles]|uniref:uncharacterized protein LOC123948021 isoform X3 n=1 Tax=Meles meles TaxID=9662 RepID=UPI001E699743|nr:uncharacterized protein LOC123948021 isoform X3 [Meles meles]
MNLVSLLAVSLGICAFVVELTAGRMYTQLPQKSLLVLLLLSSVLELDITSLTTFLGFQATFDYMWPERSPQDRTGAPSPCPQCLDGYLDSAEDMPVALAAPPESPAQQVQQPPAIA